MRWGGKRGEEQEKRKKIGRWDMRMGGKNRRMGGGMEEKEDRRTEDEERWERMGIGREGEEDWKGREEYKI